MRSLPLRNVSMAPACLTLVVALLPCCAAVHFQSGAVSETCRCLNWRDSYQSGHVECGQAFEFSRMKRDDYPPTAERYIQNAAPGMMFFYKPMLNVHFCSSFFEKFDGTSCVRTSMDRDPVAWYGKSWCYVSDECDGSIKVPKTGASVKLCETGKDTFLGDLDPEALIAYGRNMNFTTPGVMVKLAYPVVTRWFWNDRDEHSAEFKEIRDSSVPTVIDLESEESNKIIVMGSKAWELDANSYDGFTRLADVR